MNTSLLTAAKEGNLDEAKKALDKGADVNHVSEKGSTALMIASMNGHLEVVKLLVSKGADVNKITNTSALVSAATLGHYEVVKYLLNHGADVNQKVGERTALKAAVTFERDDVARLLRNSGAIDDTVRPKQEEKKEGCFIATAVYGSYSAPEVLLFRKFRDQVLLKRRLGKIFVGLYYTFSPFIARLVDNSPYVKKIIRVTVFNHLVRYLNK